MDTEEYAELMFYIAQELHERYQERLDALLDRQQAERKSSPGYLTWRRERRQAQAAEHEAHQRSIQEWEAKVQGL